MRWIRFVSCFLGITGIVFTSCNDQKFQSESNNNDSLLLQIGRHLFFDTRLSVNQTRSCGSCHNPVFAFTDSYRRSVGAFGDFTQRNSLPLFNLNTARYLTYADSSLHLAIQQMSNPLHNTNPVEMGVNSSNEQAILKLLNSDAVYKKLLNERQLHVPDETAITWPLIRRAISAYLYSIQSYDAPFDRWKNGDSTALSNEQLNGYRLFMSTQTGCCRCHGGRNFSQPESDEHGRFPYYANIGLYNTVNSGHYPDRDLGLAEHTHQTADIGAFRIPTLRNLSFTAPYFHDGSVEQLEEALDISLEGGRVIEKGTLKGDGRLHPNRHPWVKQVYLSKLEKQQLLAFLIALNDSSIRTNEHYQNPFETKKESEN